MVGCLGGRFFVYRVQAEPIVIYEEKILDGRNRYRACEIAEVEPTYRPYTGDDPIKYVISLNLHRRQLSESQRAMVGANIATLKKGEKKSDAQICAPSQPDTAKRGLLATRKNKSLRRLV